VRSTTRLAVAACAYLALAIVPDGAAAQQQVRFTGYLEHQFATSRAGDGWTMIDYDRLRVDVNARAGRGTRASAAVVYQLYRGDTQRDVRDFLPDDLAAVIGSTSVELEDLHLLNHAYVRLDPGPFEITAGKQYLTWGAGFAFNPTELFRPKNLLEPSYDREGIGALSAKVPLASLSDVMVALVPEGGFGESGKVLRARHHVAGFDLSALVAEVFESPVSGDLGTGAEELERRFAIGGDVSGELLGLGVWVEATWSNRADERWVETTVGGNYTLADGTLLMLEGYYNGRGGSGEPYPLELWLQRLSGDMRSLGKGMAYGVVNRPFGQLWTVGLSTLANVSDGSFVLIPTLSYAFAQNVDLVFNGAFYVGADGTEFGGDNHGGFLRGRVYF
jgi:hypothetical protein